MATETFELYSSVYKGFITTSIIVFLIGITTSGATTLNCYQAGYVVFGLAIMLILIRLLNNLGTIYKNSASIGKTIFIIAPFMLVLISISGLLFLNVKYRDIIISEDVSSGYFSFSKTAIILLLIQLCVINSSMNDDSFAEKGFSNVTNTSVLLIGVLIAMCTNIIRTILKYFTTDGYKNILKI
jgi:hypothetical protein